MEIKLDSILIGRVLAGIAILIALLSAIVGAANARSDGFEIFLARLATPLGVGLLIIVVTEVLRSLKEGREDSSGSEE